MISSKKNAAYTPHIRYLVHGLVYIAMTVGYLSMQGYLLNVYSGLGNRAIYGIVLMPIFGLLPIGLHSILNSRIKHTACSRMDFWRDVHVGLFVGLMSGVWSIHAADLWRLPVHSLLHPNLTTLLVLLTIFWGVVVSVHAGLNQVLDNYRLRRSRLRRTATGNWILATDLGE